MLDTIARINDAVRGVLWGPPLLILLLGTGLYFTCCTGVFQLQHIRLWLGGALRACLPRRKTDKGGQAISPFAAMCTALAATVGTGNIAGVAAALAIGGPGAGSCANAKRSAAAKPATRRSPAATICRRNT